MSSVSIGVTKLGEGWGGVHPLALSSLKGLNNVLIIKLRCLAFKREEK